VPLDSDADPENGRIYLRDSFVFDPSEKKLKSYQRTFDYNGKGQGAWADWLQKYRDTLKSNPRTIDDPVVQAFAFSAGTSFGRALTDENGATLPEFSQAYKRQHDYLDINHHMVEMNVQELGYKLKDKLNHYTVVRKDDQIHITFHIAIDGDDDPSNGRLILSDTISVDAKTWELKNFSRNWKPAPEVAEFDDWKATAERLNQVWADTDANEKKKVGELGRTFVYNMASLLLTGNDVKLEEVKPEDAFNALIAARAKTGPVEISAFAKRLQKDPRRGEATLQILEAIGVLTNESLSQRHDSELGWWNSKILHHTPIDIERVQKANAAVLKKSLEAAAGKPTATAFEVMQSLTLEGDEAAARDRILANKVAVELNSIGAEADPELRAIGLLHFADQRLFRRLSMPLAAQTILAGLENSPFVQDKARAVLATMGGKGTFGDKFEYFLPKIAKQIAHPATLIAMGGAPFLGAAAEGLGLAGISRFGTVLGGTGRVNFAGRWLAGAFGLSGEAFAFTALHQAGASAVHDPDKVTANFGNEFKSGLLLFGAMRAAHAGVNPLTARIFTKNPVEAELLTSPTGRVLLNPRWGGGQASWLSRNIAMPTVNHGTGIVAMHLANSLSRRFELMPNDGQDQWSHFLESALTYGQAVAGFNLANRLTLGRLQSTLGEAKLRLDELGRNQAPLGKRSRQVSNSPKSPGLTFSLNGKWKIDAERTKRIWVGSIPGRRPGVEYEDGFAKINVGNENTVSEWHAVLVRDQSGSYWFAADAGSTYGTFLNNKRLEPGEHTRFKNGSILQLGDSYQLRIDVDGKLMTPPDPLKTQVVVDVPQAPSQKRLGPPPIADAFPFEMLYPGYEVSADAVVEVAQLRPSKGEPWKLTSKTTGWGNAKS
ncbi:MAG TPA: FHA domain-containing protein, partial [bacterium]|nr:FHA domain-containing protein [bacterium]